jgi:hypothetical protein
MSIFTVACDHGPTVSVAALVLAHRDPDQVERLAQRLECPVWVHYDAKSPAAEHERLRRSPHVHVVEDRVRVRWGDPSTLTAILRGLAAVGGDPDHVLLLSGQTYPIKPPPAIRERLSEPVTFVRHLPLPIAAWGLSGGLDRTRRFWVNRPTFAPGWVPPRIGLPLPRRLPRMQLFGGETWLALHRDARRHVLDLPSTAPVFKLMRHALLAEEMFLQTVLPNSPLAGALVNDSLHFIRWAGGSHPAPLTPSDLPALRETDALFARKFTADDPMLDLIDRDLLGAPAPS